MKSVKAGKKSERWLVSVLGSFMAGVMLTWALGVSSPAAKSEERSASISSARIEVADVAAASSDDAASTNSLSGHSEISLQLD